MSTSKIIVLILVIAGAGSLLPQIVLAIIRKRKKLNSFVISENDNRIVVAKSFTVSILNSTSLFFTASLFGLILPGIATFKDNLFMQLSLTYLLAAVLSFLDFKMRRNFKIIIDRSKHTITIKKKTYSLFEFNQLVIDNRRVFWGSNEMTYALYIRNSSNNHKLVYGYSIFRDIEALKFELETRMGV